MARGRKKPAKTLIKNYGLLWRRDAVFWGKQGKTKMSGGLLGKHKRRTVDFRDQIGAYVLYDENRVPIYVGEAGKGKARLFSRLKTHCKNTFGLRWQYFSWFGFLRVNKSGALTKWDAHDMTIGSTLGHALDEIEGVLITAMEPRLNKQGARFKGIHRYDQVTHEESEQVALGEVFDLLKAIDKRFVGFDKKLEKLTAAMKARR